MTLTFNWPRAPCLLEHIYLKQSLFPTNGFHLSLLASLLSKEQLIMSLFLVGTDIFRLISPLKYLNTCVPAHPLSLGLHEKELFTRHVFLCEERSSQPRGERRKVV